MRRKSQTVPGYFLQYERCIKQHHFSPKIFICVEESCNYKNLLCHYCINDSYHNYQEQDTYQCASRTQPDEEVLIKHTGHKIIPIEEYINLFRNLYFNGNQLSNLNVSSSLSFQLKQFSESSPSNINTTSAGSPSSTPTSTQSSSRDWKEGTQIKYLNSLKCLKNQIQEIYQFVEGQIQDAEKMIASCFQNLSNHEKAILECYTQFDSKNDAVSSEIVSQFVNTSFNFLIDSQSRLISSKNIGGYLEFAEYSSITQPLQLITQRDIQTKITHQLNHIKKIADYFQTISNDMHKKFKNGLISAPFYQSPIHFLHKNSNQNHVNTGQSNSLSEFSQVQFPSEMTGGININTSPSIAQLESSELIPAFLQSPMLGISPVTFGNNLNLPENLFAIRSPIKKLTDIHTKSIWRVLYLYKSICASCSSDGTIKIWDFKKQKIIQIFNSFTDAVNDIIYLAKQKLLISVSGDNKIRVFSLINFKCIRIIDGHLNAIYTCHYDPIKNILLTAGREQEVYGWNLISGERVLKTKSILRSIYSLQSVSSKDSFLIGDEGGTLSVFNYNRLQLVRNQTIHSKTIYSIKVITIHNGSSNINSDIQIVTSSADGFIKITSFETLDILNQVKLNSFVYDISIYMNRIFAQVGKTSNLAIIGLTQQRGNIEMTTKLLPLNNSNKVRCMQIIKDQNILLYESTSNDINYDMNIEQF